MYISLTPDELTFAKSTNLHKLRKSHPSLVQQIESMTAWLDQYPGHRFKDRIYCIVNNITSMPICACGCGQPVGNVNAKFVNTHGNRLKEVQDKVRQACLLKYGVDNISKLESVRNERRQTAKTNFTKAKDVMMAKYGVDSSFKLPEVQKKISKYWQDHPEELAKRESKRLSKIKKTVYKDEGILSVDIVNSFKQLSSFLSSAFGEVEIVPELYRVLIHHKKFAVQFINELGGDRKRYVNQLDEFKERGYRLISIYEDEWRNKRKIVTNRLRHILGKSRYTIGARECEVREIDSTIANRFVDKYHLQGKINSKVYLGAYYKNRLIGVMTFGSLRKAMGTVSVSGCYELYRFCTMGSLISFPGIANKIFKHFTKTYKPDMVKTFADRRWSDGKLYEKLGFTFVHNSSPSYCYIKSNNGLERYHRSQFQKHMLEGKLKSYDPALTEWKNMLNNGYARIWDCGTFVYEMNLTS